MLAIYNRDIKKTKAFLINIRIYFRYFLIIIATNKIKVSVTALQLNKTVKD